MNDSATRIADMETALNDAAMMCSNANEDNLSFVHGYFVGISQGITAMGYICQWDNALYRFTVERDELKNAGEMTYVNYTVKIIENHFILYMKAGDPEHEQAIMDGMEEVLRICGYALTKNIGQDGFSAHKIKKMRSLT